MKQFIPEFEIIPAKGEEKTKAGLSPKKLVVELARQKACEVADLSEARQKAVVGSDTVVVFRGEVLGKPKCEADAKRMLTALSGKKHRVYTGVCILTPDRRHITGVGCTKVRFENLSEKAIEEYIATGSPMDKAGAYGIQDGGIVKSIQGSYSNVVGFPCELFARLMKRVK